nr:MAG TPA: hypothetical protein [Caudoviricetes sp.]
MSDCKTIVTFDSGRTETLNGDWIAEIMEKNTVQKWQFFPSDDRKRFVVVINMDLVESVRVVEYDN